MGMVIEPNTKTNKFSSEVVELVDDKVNKYNPGKQLFRFLSMTGLQESTTKKEETNINISAFLMNKDLTPFQNTQIKITRTAVIKLDLPKDVTRNYPHAKYIPCGTRFTVSFENGDITKPKIIAGRWEDGIMNKEEPAPGFDESATKTVSNSGGGSGGSSGGSGGDFGGFDLDSVIDIGSDILGGFL